MDANTPQESSQPGEAELPTPSFSGSGDSSTSDGAEATVSKLRSALLEELKPLIRETIEKQVQSTKDKRIAKIEGRLGMLAELEEQGATIPENLKQEMRFRDLEERLTQPAQPAERVDNGLSTQKQAVTDAIAKLTEYGLTSNDPAFIELLRGKYQNKDAFDKAVLGHIVTKLAPSKSANPADVVQSPVTAGATSKGVETLAMEYKTKMLAAPRGRAGDAQRSALKAEYERQGVPIHSIDFT